MSKYGFIFAFLGVFSLFGQQTRTRNVIVVLADQLRADRLHVYGNSRPTSPNIDRFASEGTRFSRYYSAAPWTAPSQGTIVTGLYPSRHGETIFAPRKSPPAMYPEGTTTLAEAFKQAGYHTAAFIANPVAGPYLTGRGIDDFDLSDTLHNDPRGTAPAVTGRILNWLDRNQSQPFFMYIDYFEPHWPYDPPAEHDLFKNDAYPGTTIAMNFLHMAGLGGFDLTRDGNIGDRQAIERMVQLYDGKIHYADASLGVLFDELKRRGLNENTVVMFSSDHGELLYSHVEDWDTPDHRSLYDAAVHVPAIFWGAGIPAHQVVDGIASHVNTANTLLDLAGLPLKSDAQGPSVAPMIRGELASVNPYVFGEQEITQPLRSVRNSQYKLILEVHTGKKRLFDTVNDPDELMDVATLYPDVLRELSDALQQYRNENEPAFDVLRERWTNLLQAAHIPSTTEIDEVSLGADMQLNGDGWRTSTSPLNLYGGAYWSEAAGGNEPIRKALWRTDNPLFGRFFVYIRYGALPDGGVATDVPVTIQSRYGAQLLRVDQTSGAGEWQLLTAIDDPISVSITNEANGRVIVDAVRFEQVLPDSAQTAPRLTGQSPVLVK